MLRGLYGDGGRIVLREPEGTTRVLTESFHSACEFDVSFDAHRILFAAKQSKADSWGIWEMSANGSDARQITQFRADCRTPAYQATLYTLVSPEPWYQIMFSSDHAGLMNEYGSGAVYSLYSCRLDGSSVRRLTMNPGDALDPFLMQDGRVLFASWQRGDLRRDLLGRAALFAVNTDGTDYMLFYGDDGDRVKHMPSVTNNGLVVFVEADSAGWDGAGQLGSVTLRRNHHSYRRVTHDPAQLYHSPALLPDGTLLVSSRPAKGNAPHAVWQLDPTTGKQKEVFADPRFHCIHAKALVPRREPDGRSSVVDERHSTGKLYCLNAYTSHADTMPHLKDKAIKRLRVIEGVPLRADRGEASSSSGSGRGADSLLNALTSQPRRRLLGVVEVMKDGSFHLEVPADVPIQLQALDEDGMALESCGWIWVKPGEARGCIGCHEDPELAPENRFVEALQRPAMRLTLPEQKRRTVDFRRDVMPIVRAKCTGCHSSDATAINLGDGPRSKFNRAYESLVAPAADRGGGGGAVMGRYVHPGRARTSPLVWRLWGRNTSRPWDKSQYGNAWTAVCPPSGAVPLTDAEKLAFIEWIDLGAHWEGAVQLQTSDVGAAGGRSD